MMIDKAATYAEYPYSGTRDKYQYSISADPQFQYHLIGTADEIRMASIASRLQPWSCSTGDIGNTVRDESAKAFEQWITAQNILQPEGIEEDASGFSTKDPFKTIGTIKVKIVKVERLKPSDYIQIRTED